MFRILHRPKTTGAPKSPKDVIPEAVKEEGLEEILENEEITLEDIESFEEELERDIEKHFQAGETTPEHVLAQSATEIFGASSPATAGTQTLKYDPAQLPRPVTLEELGRNFSEEDYATALVHGRGIHFPYFHPRTHDIPVANIQFRSHHPKLLELFTHFAVHAASSLGIPTSRVYSLPTQRSLWTVPRSPFVHKKSQENFERKVHKRGIKAWDADPEVVDRWAQYLVRHQMGGVGMRIVKWERMPVGVGKTRYAQVKGALQTPASVDEGSVKELGKKIIVEEMKNLKGPSVTGKAVTKIFGWLPSHRVGRQEELWLEENLDNPEDYEKPYELTMSHRCEAVEKIFERKLIHVSCFFCLVLLHSTKTDNEGGTFTLVAEIVCPTTLVEFCFEIGSKSRRRASEMYTLDPGIRSSPVPFAGFNEALLYLKVKLFLQLFSVHRHIDEESVRLLF
ncbi:mitochondrial 37S ribosomal protein rsm10 [Marasmius crinis-equi]|uniref:Mitochondrial 37S ribosomal protein rsm10 n=1 Tax=Marasmius crinis-equi TaxID=585013 RepID=A0ABR3FF82_9AGAR